MTDTYGPFDTASWAQDQWYRHAPIWAPSGLYSNSDLQITFSGLNFTIGTGRAWVRGAGFERTGSPASQAIPANTNASLSRRDRVVLRRDLGAKTVAPTLIQGTPSASPTAPAITQNETGQWDLPLWSFLVPPNSGTSITGTVDERAYLDYSTGGPLLVQGNLSLTGNYTSTSARYGAAMWVQEGSRMRLRGSITNAVAPAAATSTTAYQIGTLPAGTAPAGIEGFPAAFGDGVSKVGATTIEVHSDGTVWFIAPWDFTTGAVRTMIVGLRGATWIIGA